jgi:IclR family pca regulon transcriptional regulator
VSAVNDETQPNGDANFMLSIARGLSVLSAFDGDNRMLAVSDVARRADLPAPSARRCLYTLKQLGYVEEQAGVYFLTPKVLSLGFSYLCSSTLAERVASPTKRLADLTGEFCSTAVLDGSDIVYIARSKPDRTIALDRPVGYRLPAHYVSTGRVLLAYLPDEDLERRLAVLDLSPRTPRSIRSVKKLRTILRDVRKTGYAINDCEMDADARGISVPIRTRAQNVVAALNIGAPASRLSVEQLKDFLPMMRSLAVEISETLDL